MARTIAAIAFRSVVLRFAFSFFANTVSANTGRRSL